MKYFGVGLPRTGTKSLAAAFTMLGLRTQHVVLNGYEDYDAFCDTPVWADYQKLDRMYPGSKFILTIRDADEWANSFEKNVQMNYNFLVTTGPSETMHPRHNQDVRAYGSKFGGNKYERNHFKKIFVNHNTDVIRYFAGTSNLLVLNVADESAFQEFLAFMGRGIGSVRFPQLSRGWDGPVNP